MEVRVADLKTSNNVIFKGHSAPILGVAIDPKEKYIVSIFFHRPLSCIYSEH